MEEYCKNILLARASLVLYFEHILQYHTYHVSAKSRQFEYYFTQWTAILSHKNNLNSITTFHHMQTISLHFSPTYRTTYHSTQGISIITFIFTRSLGIQTTTCNYPHNMFNTTHIIILHQLYIHRIDAKANCNIDFVYPLVYPTGSILEMSNGYPHSTSPLGGGSPSPGASPSLGGHHLKCEHALSHNNRRVAVYYYYYYYYFCQQSTNQKKNLLHIYSTIFRLSSLTKHLYNHIACDLLYIVPNRTV